MKVNTLLHNPSTTTPQKTLVARLRNISRQRKTYVIIALAIVVFLLFYSRPTQGMLF